MWLIAAYFGAKASILAYVVFRAYTDPARSNDCVAIMEKLVPILADIHGSAALIIPGGLFFSVFGFAICFGVLARSIYAIGYVLAFHGLALLQFLGAKLLFHWIGLNDSGPSLSSPTVKFQIVADLLMVLYLLSPSVLSELARSGSSKMSDDSDFQEP